MRRLPLAGRTVVVTRSSRQSQSLTAELEHLGAQVLSIPSIRMELSDDLREWRAAMDRRRAIKLVVFTSSNSARFLLDLAEGDGIPLSFWKERAVAAVGRATGEFLESRGLAPDFIPRTSTGAALATELVETGRAGPESVILVPRSAVASPDVVEFLRAAGALVFAPPVYQTKPESAEKAKPLLARLDGGELVDAVTFASPSALRGLLEMTGDRGRDWLKSPTTRIVSIGPTTSKAVREEGLDVAAEASRPDMKEVAAAVVSALAGS